MSLVNAKCTNCGANLKVDDKKDAAVCEFCGSAYIVEKAIKNYSVNNHIRADVVNIYNGKSILDRDDSDYILASVLDTDEGDKVLKAQKAFEEHEYSECLTICKNILSLTGGKSRKAWEILIDNEFTNNEENNAYKKCLFDIFNSEKKVEERYEEFVRKSPASTYIKNYLNTFNDNQAKSFIKSFQQRIDMLYGSINSRKVPVKTFLDDFLSNKCILKLEQRSTTNDIMFEYRLWKDNKFYFIEEIGYNPRVFAFNSLSDEIKPYKRFDLTNERKWDFWLGKWKNVRKVQPAQINNNGSFYIYPYSIDNYISVWGHICSVEIIHDRKWIDSLYNDIKKYL